MGMSEEQHEYPEFCSTRQCHTSVFPPLISIACFIYHPHEPSCVVSQVKLMIETKKLSASAIDEIPEPYTHIAVFLRSLVNWALEQRCFVWWVRCAVLEHHVSIAFVIAKGKKRKQKLVNLDSAMHYINPLYWGIGYFAIVSFLVLYFQLNKNKFVIVKNISNQMACITLLHSNLT